MKERNYRSDFDFILPYPVWTEGEDGKPVMKDIGWPDFDWEVRLWTWNRSNAVVVSRHGDTLVNCFNDGGRIHVVLDNHNLGAGKLMADYHSMLPDVIYPDGVRDEFWPMELSIELVAGAGDCPTEVEVQTVLPVIRGKDAYTYAVEHGYEGTEAEFGQSLAEMPNIFAVDPAGEFETPELPGYRRLLVDMWCREWGKNGGYDYAATDGRPYLGNGLRMTYEQAVAIMTMPQLNVGNLYAAYDGIAAKSSIHYRKLPTHRPTWIKQTTIGVQTFSNNEFEVINAPFFIAGGFAFANNHTLKKCTFYSFSNQDGAPFMGCEALETIEISKIGTGFSVLQLQWCPLVTNESFQRIISLYDRTTAFTIIVHKDVYAKLTGDTTNAAAAALTSDELEQWQQVMVDAAGKNITFATT